MNPSAKDRILAALVPAEIVDLAKALVRIPSYTTDETPVARFLDELFRRNSVIGMEKEIILRRFRTSMPTKFEVADQPGVISGVVIGVQSDTGRATSILRVP